VGDATPASGYQARFAWAAGLNRLPANNVELSCTQIASAAHDSLQRLCAAYFRNNPAGTRRSNMSQDCVHRLKKTRFFRDG
jgi:hypothetical protein